MKLRQAQPPILHFSIRDETSTSSASYTPRESKRDQPLVILSSDTQYHNIYTE